MLREKIDKPRLPAVLPSPGAPPQSSLFLPSEWLLALRAKQRRLGKELRSAQVDPTATEGDVRELLRKVELAAAEVKTLETREREEHAKRRDAQLRHYRGAKAAYEASVRRRQEALRRHNEMRSRRAA